MIYVEKLSNKNLHSYRFQTFIDNLLADKQSRINIAKEFANLKIRNYSKMDQLYPYLKSKLKQVELGKFFGPEGVDIDILLSDRSLPKNLAIEISLDHINQLPKKKIKLLLENFAIILCDFDEGGNLFGPSGPQLVSILSEYNIKPKQIFLVGGCFDMQDCLDLNIHKVNFDYWLIASIILDNKFSPALFDLSFKESVLQQLEKVPNQFCIAPVLKPRVNRLQLLSELDKNQILDKCNWSLGYNMKRSDRFFYNKYDFSGLSTEEQNNISNFLNKYTFPKLLKNECNEFVDVITGSEWFNQYKFYLSMETYIGNEYSHCFGPHGFITEKTYKSFIIGSNPIIYGPTGSAEYLKNMGFRVPFCIDSSDNKDSIVQALHNLTDTQYDVQVVQDNFDLITNLDFLLDSIAKPLEKVADLINSIRR